jgi:parallel beta-helix repeat protein
MKKTSLKKGLVFVVLILFLGLTFAPSINADIDTSAASNQDKQTQKLIEEELYESRYMDSPHHYRYMTEDGQIHTVTKTRADFISERTKYRDKDLPIKSANGEIGNHPPIYIEGNDDFTSENGVTGGSGTEEDPYIIEGWVIVGDGSTGEGIFINNTDAHFVIRNCNISYFTGKFYSGIKFSNVINGKIEGTDAHKNYDGIKIYDSAYIEIINCTIHHNTGYYADGIDIVRSSNIKIISCESYNHGGAGDCSNCINLLDTQNSLIEDTKCYNAEWNGIHMIFRCEYITVKDCEIYGNYLGGIDIFSSSIDIIDGYNRIVGCEIYDNGHDPFYDNGFAGIEISWNNNNIVENCHIHHNGEGVVISSAHNNIVRNCSIHDHYMSGGFIGSGIMIFGGFFFRNLRCNFNKVENCNVYNEEFGIDLTDCFMTSVLSNNIYNNSMFGLMSFGMFVPLTIGVIRNNNIYDNGFGREWGRGFAARLSFFDARNNWWGSADGPSYHGPGNGDKFERLWSFVLIRPWAKEYIPDVGVQE